MGLRIPVRALTAAATVALAAATGAFGATTDRRPNESVGGPLSGWLGKSGPAVVARDAGALAAAADTASPDTTITGGASGTTTATRASFTFASTESRSSFQCR